MLTSAHRTAVLQSIDLVETVRPNDLSRATPCAGWDLRDLLSHMTAQHRGFAAAARGLGADPTVWQAHSSDGYAVAARDVLEAFSADGIDDAPFALPEFGPDAVFPGSIAMGFHFVDYVVHAWDVAASLGVDYELPEHVLAAALPLVLAIPDGDVRDLENVPFDRAVQSGGGADDFSRILRHLGRDPQWSRR